MKQMLTSYEAALDRVNHRIKELRILVKQPDISQNDRDSLAARIGILVTERKELERDITHIRSYVCAREEAAKCPV